MKKILALVIVSMFSLNCMARNIAVRNNSPETFMVEDYFGDAVTVTSDNSGTLNANPSATTVIVTDNANRVKQVSIVSKTSITINADYSITTN